VKTLRIAVFAGYMPFFDEIMPEGYAGERDARGRDLGRSVTPNDCESVYLGLVRDHASGAAAGKALAAGGFDCVLVVPTMATPAGYLWETLGPNPNIPVVIYAAHEIETIGADFDMPALCRNSASVGALMIGNLLSRAGRPFRVVVGHGESPDAIGACAAELRRAAIAGSIRRARLGVLGRPLDGYDNVAVDAEALARAVGMTTIDMPLDEWNATQAAVGEDDVARERAFVTSLARLDDRGRPRDVEAALRLSCALESAITQHDLSAGAINCRGAFGVGRSEHPSLGCLAISAATARGVPFTCTADAITAIAMLIGKRLSDSALYCELDAIDEARDAFLCANTGEGDLSWPGCHSRIFVSGADSGRSAPGCSVRQSLPPGPATAIGFSPNADARGGFTLLAMEGETLVAPDVALSVTPVWFRATRRPMREAMQDWIRAGATHHCCLSHGRLANELAILAEHLRIGFTRI
jgi:L-arabinose isomerase